MDSIIAFDSHKRYTLASVENEQGRIVREQRIEHSKGQIRRFLSDPVRARKGHSVAVGAVAKHLAESAYWGRNDCRMPSGYIHAAQTAKR